MKYIKPSLILLVVSVLLVGCGTENQILDDVDIVQGISYEYIKKKGKEELLEGTALIPVFSEGNTGEFNTQTARSVTGASFIAKTSMKTPRPLVLGQLRIALFGEEYSKKGIEDTVDTLYRNHELGTLLRMAVTEQDPKDYLNMKYNANENPAVYLSTLIDQNIKYETVPQTNLHLFYNYYLQKGRDPYLPHLKKELGTVSIDGVALFREDKYIKKLPLKQMFIFKMLLDDYRNGAYEFEIAKNGKYASIENISSKSKVFYKGPKESPTLHIKLKVEGQIIEYPENQNLQIPKEIDKVEKYIENQLEKETVKIIDFLRMDSIDSIGLEKRYFLYNQKYKRKEWKQLYKDMPIKVKADVHIVQSGVAE
ncbi:Ger(x)C family spore germination protein [Peribacillus acanthi]|uniref:Ger(x)C family spore germination protein n=1 Tax=Peribacillus acanthi TaxID=2171554 RepID=UPI000D3E98B9|nr:Ger(x)C family spore germination protein [Peribacillus acanthi]